MVHESIAIETKNVGKANYGKCVSPRNIVFTHTHIFILQKRINLCVWTLFLRKFLPQYNSIQIFFSEGNQNQLTRPKLGLWRIPPSSFPLDLPLLAVFTTFPLVLHIEKFCAFVLNKSIIIRRFALDFIHIMQNS